MDSPFKPMLKTNFIPTDAEIQDTGNLLVHSVHDLSSLKTEISQVQATLHNLIEKCTILSGDIDAHRALKTSARRVPRDVLEEIFIACLDPFDDASMSPSVVPLILCYICSSWRSIALGTPQLWTSLHVLIPRYQSPNSDDYRRSGLIAAEIPRWLGRSGNLPPSITVSILKSADFDYKKAHLYPEISNPCHDLLRQNIIAFSRRWGCITQSSLRQIISSSLFRRLRMSMSRCSRKSTSETIPFLIPEAFQTGQRHVFFEVF